jgi:pyrroline-5-carboxylate reductase
MDLSSQCVGFVGTGKISSCLVRGFAGAGAHSRPRRILVSPRNEDKARALATEFPGLVEIARDNAQVVSESDVVFIGLLPAVARSELPTLPFGGAEGGKLVVSMMAAVDIEEMKSLTGVSADRIVRTVPLPSSSRREGPILVHPKLPRFDELLSVVGTPVGCATEEEMKPLICLTGHISSFFELMRTTQAFMESEGVDQATARLYVSSFYSSLARATELSGESLADMAVEARTPGGINEQCMRILGSSQHFSMQQQSLAAILRRLRGQEVYVPLSASAPAPAESEGER